MRDPGGSLEMWTVYEGAKGFPANFVVRRCLIGSGGIVHDEKAWCLAESLEQARKSLPKGLVRIDRQPEDEPHIVETWF